MLDLVLVAVILAFFLAGALLVRALGRLIAASDLDEPGDELFGEASGSQTDPESPSLARRLLDRRT